MLGSNEVCATLAVKDLGAAKKFYGEVLGLEASKESPGGVFYKSGKGGVFVYPSQYAGTNQATAAAWDVDDIENVVADLAAKGVKFEHYEDMPETKLEGDIHVMGETKMAWLKDPDGNILNLVKGM